MSFSDHHSRTGLVHHGTRIALTPSRAVTSHLRRRYHEKYNGQYRFAWLVFLFDTALLAIALGLIVVNVVLYTSPASPPSGLELIFNAPELVAARPVPVEVVLKSKDGQRHEHIELTWQLPPNVEVLRADPPLTANKAIQFASVGPGQEGRSRVYLLIRALPGAKTAFQFQLREQGERSGILIGQEERPVVRSALTAELALPRPIDRVASSASLPLLIFNDSSHIASAVVVRLLEKKNAPGSTFGVQDELRIGTLNPQEKRVVFIDIDPTAQDSVEFSWEISDSAVPVSHHTFKAEIVSEPLSLFVQGPLSSIPKATATQVRYSDSPGGQLWVHHPLQVTPTDEVTRMYDVGIGEGEVHIPLHPDKRTHDTIWSVIPLEVRQGQTVMGRRVVGSLLTAFPFQAAVRYYTTTGDQVGIGSLPPRVGELTTYWMVWSIGPTDADLKDVTLRAALASGVSATGKFASAIPGQFSTDGSNVSWSIPSLPVTGDTPATFAFEIGFTPTRTQRGSVPTLILESTATATEVRSGLPLNAAAPKQDTNLEFDVQGRGKGKVE